MTLLFRPEAVAHASRRLAGDVVLATPLSFRIQAGFAVAVVIAALVFVSLATYARKETVVGWLSPDRGMIRLAARQAGVLENVMVREGDWVDAGQPVA
jgi:membrane fusion protein